ncbi:MAG: ABC transporter permease, partial [Flavobacteriales bacterium]|nr:ABC transporter permease [Flavobacteriales bacterium]
MKLWASIKKEWLILIRDRGGLAILFLMPMVLVVIMAIVQDAPFRDYQEQQISVLFVDNDKGVVSTSIMSGINDGDAFNVISKLEDLELNNSTIAETINSGDYQIGIIINPGLSEQLQHIVDEQVNNMLAGLIPVEEELERINQDLQPYITLLLDPTTKSTFRNTIRSAIKQFLAELEAKMIIDGLSGQLAEMTGKEPEIDLSSDGIVQLQETTVTGKILKPDVANNSTQHNVPAWNVFAMFFVVIPLAGNMVRERTAGTIMRLQTMPTTMTYFYGGKLLSYAVVALLQSLLMISVGFWLLPNLGLAKLDLGSGVIPLIYVSITVGMAATAYGLLVGTIFKTHHQSAIFGIVSVVIMAALGGIWVPLYIMSDT